MKKVIIYLASCICLLTACSSPENKGHRLAQKYNRCGVSYKEELKNNETQFVKNFDPSLYDSRTEATEKYFVMRDKCNDKYSVKTDEIRQKFYKELKKMKNKKKAAAFYSAFVSEVEDIDIDNTNHVPPQVLCVIAQIVPPVPNEEQIALDIINRYFGEATVDGYFHDITFHICSGEVKDLRIENCQKTQNRVKLKVHFTLVKNSSFKVTSELVYVLTDTDETWRIKSFGNCKVEIIRTGLYDNSIRTQIADDGWGGINCLRISNLSDVNLVVGGEIYADGEWRKFTTEVEPLGKKQVGGLFGGGNVTNYQIHFVEVK